MRKLFDQFEALSAQAQRLLEKGIGQRRDGIAPDSALCQEITAALSSLRAAYDDIRKELPEHILAEKMPVGDLPVRAYEEAWNNSVLSRKKAVRGVLEEFIRVYSDEQKYMDAIGTYIHDAQNLLVSIDSTELQTQSPDISSFQLFLDGIKADLSADEALYDRLLDDSGFSPRIVKGLYDKKYYIQEAETVSKVLANAQTEEPSAATEPLNDHSEADTPSAITMTAETQDVASDSKAETDDGIETLTLDEFAEKYVTGEDAVSEETISPTGNEPTAENTEAARCPAARRRC